jgi:hypothetical protein
LKGVRNCSLHTAAENASHWNVTNQTWQGTVPFCIRGAAPIHASLTEPVRRGVLVANFAILSEHELELELGNKPRKCGQQMDLRWTLFARGVRIAPQAAGEDRLQSKGQHALAALRCQTAEVCPFGAYGVVVVSNRWSYHLGIPRYPCRSRRDTIRHRQPCSPQACASPMEPQSLPFSRISAVPTFVPPPTSTTSRNSKTPLFSPLPPSQPHS